MAKSTSKKPPKKRKRFGKTGTNTRQAKASQRSPAGAKPARQAAQKKLLREAQSIALAAIEALDAGDLDTVRIKLMTIASRVDQ
jgi:hypothetical protein